MAFYLWRNTVVGLNAEATRGEWAAPAVTDLFEVANLEEPTVNGEVLEWFTLRNTFTPDKYIMGNITCSFGFDMAMPLGFATDAARNAWCTYMSDVFKACGFQTSTIAVDVDIDITPDDDADTGMSCAINVEGLEYRIRGAAGNVQWIYEAGQIARLHFTFEGVYNGCAEDTLTGTPNGINPQVVEDMTLFRMTGATSGATEACLNTMTVDAGLELAQYPCALDDKGISHYFPANRKVSASINAGNFLDAHGGSTAKDDELDTMFTSGEQVTTTLSSPIYTNLTDMTVVGELTGKTPANVNGAHNYDIEQSGSSATAEGEMTWTLYKD